MLTFTEACKLYGVPISVLVNWVTVSGFPVIRVRGQNTVCYYNNSQNYLIDPKSANDWINERVQGVVEGRQLFIGHSEEPNKSAKIIIDKAEHIFLKEYLFPNMPPHVQGTVEKAEFDDLRRNFVGGCTRSRWFEAAGGIMGHNALEKLKREGDFLRNLVGFEARLYALFIRSLDCSRSKCHPEFKSYARGVLSAGTFDHLNKKIVQQAKIKYGTEHVQGLIYGSSHWKR
jgi:hypothetical protein